MKYNQAVKIKTQIVSTFVPNLTFFSSQNHELDQKRTCVENL